MATFGLISQPILAFLRYPVVAAIDAQLDLCLPQMLCFLDAPSNLDLVLNVQKLLSKFIITRKLLQRNKVPILEHTARVLLHLSEAQVFHKHEALTWYAVFYAGW